MDLIVIIICCTHPISKKICIFICIHWILNAFKSVLNYFFKHQNISLHNTPQSKETNFHNFLTKVMSKTACKLGLFSQFFSNVFLNTTIYSLPTRQWPWFADSKDEIQDFFTKLRKKFYSASVRNIHQTPRFLIFWQLIRVLQKRIFHSELGRILPKAKEPLRLLIDFMVK